MDKKAGILLGGNDNNKDKGCLFALDGENLSSFLNYVNTSLTTRNTLFVL